jgi:hypothetical protein
VPNKEKQAGEQASKAQAKQSKAKQSKAEQSRAERSKAKQIKAEKAKQSERESKQASKQPAGTKTFQERTAELWHRYPMPRRRLHSNKLPRHELLRLVDNASFLCTTQPPQALFIGTSGNVSELQGRLDSRPAVPSRQLFRRSSVHCQLSGQPPKSDGGLCGWLSVNITMSRRMLFRPECAPHAPGVRSECA